MRSTYVVHIVAGGVSLLAGFVALYSAKGGALHRRSGMLFVYAMLAMAAGGVTIALARDTAPAINVPAGTLTAYLVLTALTAVRPPVAGARWLHLAGLAAALGVGVATLAFGLEAVAGGGTRKGMPAFPFFMFAAAALLGAAGDLRMIRTGPLRGAPRIARHLWRMSFALFIASLSFFIGQAKIIPKPIRIMPLLAMPVLAVLATMLYWLWRVRVRRALRGLAIFGAPNAA